tara:strand:+ start:296 stop:547 length:252 start_codon:yes stop_codon:yes gene_type:complete
MNLINQIPTIIGKSFLLSGFVGCLTSFGFLLTAIAVNNYELYIMDNQKSVQYLTDAIVLLAPSGWFFLIGLWIELKIIDKEGE